MNSPTTVYEKFIFQRKSLHNLKRVKLDIQTFNVLMALDGKRSVGDIRDEDIYEQSFLEEKIQLLLKLGLIEPVTKNETITNFKFLKSSLMKNRQPAGGDGIKPITVKLRQFVLLIKAPLFWYAAGSVIIAFLFVLAGVFTGTKQLTGDTIASLRWPVPKTDAGDEPVTKIYNIEPETSWADPSEITGADPSEITGADRSEISGADPSEVSGVDPSEVSGADPSEVSGVDPSEISGADRSEISGPDRAQTSGQEKSTVQSTELSYDLSTPYFDVPAALPADDQPKETEVDRHADINDAPAHPVQIKTKQPSRSLKKKPPKVKLPYLTVKEITSKARPVSEGEFLHYLDQTGTKSNWKEILLYASRRWRLEVPMIEKYNHLNNYLEYYNKLHNVNRLAIHSALCSLHELKVFNMLAILEFRHPQHDVPKYLVLKMIDYQKAVLSNGKSKDDIIITHDQLERFWSGTSHIPWQKVIQSADVINTSSPQIAVKELKAYLNSVGFHNLDDPEKYNRKTVSAIKQIQTRFGIEPTGIVDVVTHAAFNRYRDRVNNQTGPRDKT